MLRYVVVLSVLVGWVGHVRGAVASTAATPDELARGLGGKAGDWQFGATAPGGGMDTQVQTLDGKPALVVGPHGLVVTSTQPIQGDARLVFLVRFTAPLDQAASLLLTAGIVPHPPAQENAPQLGLKLQARRTLDVIYYSYPPAEGVPGERYEQDHYTVKRVPDMTNWPALVRIHAAEDLATMPSLSEKWVEVRLDVQPARVRALPGRSPRPAPRKRAHAGPHRRYLHPFALGRHATEGPCIAPSIPGSLTQDEEAENTSRTFLTLMGYNVTQFTGWPNLFRCAWAWGEHSYGAGLSAPLPLLNPNVGMAAFATLTRQINRMNFVKWLPTGSNTVFCYQFKHYKTGDLLHVMWTVRGTRPVTLTLKPGENVVVYDAMDNDTALTPPPGHAKVTFTITTAPCFIHGLTADPQISLGVPDHSDARPGQDALKIASPGDGTWRQVNEHDGFYENSDLTYERRFLGNMTSAVKPAPALPGAGAAQSGQALAIHLEKQDKQRYVMPYYTTLVPAKPVVIPGQATHLGIWVQGHSDWGRVVYFLRDAKGQPWVSVGTPSGVYDGDANNDTHAWSQFCFDGWRYLKFELPANAPWDCYRENGTVWWGGPGITAVAELPLTIEKIAIERRTHVIYADTLVPADPTDVLLGDLYAEYANPADQTDEAVKLSKLRMPEAVAAAAAKP